MRKVMLQLDPNDYAALENAARKKGVSIEEWAADAVHLMLSTHTIDYEDFERGYQSTDGELI